MSHPLLRFFYRILLRLAPRDLREWYGPEMERLFAETLEFEIRRRGWLGYAYVLFGAAADVVGWRVSSRAESRAESHRGSGPALLPRIPPSGLLRDFVHSFRSLRKSPGFTATTVLTLGLGLGSTIAIISIVDVVLLRPLPFPDPDQLVTISENNVELGHERAPVAPPTFVDWKTQAESFTEMSALVQSSLTLTGGEFPERVRTISASQNVFALLGVAMHEGGPFPLEAEDPGSSHWVVLSFDFWQRWFAGDAGAIGQTLDLGEEAHTIVGVLPEDFRFPQEAELWTPLGFQPEELTEDWRTAHYLSVIARLRSDSSADQARAEMAVISDALGERYADKAGWGAHIVGLHESMAANSRGLMLLLLSTLLVLSIAGVNVVNLVLVKVSNQRREEAVKQALGATRWCLLREALVQNLSLAMLGGLVGVVVAWWALPTLIRLAPAEIPRMEDVAIDARLVAVSMALSVLVGLILTMVSMWLKVGSATSLAPGSKQVGGTRNRHRFHRGLIVAEVGLSLVLLIGTGLLARTIAELHQVDPGFSATDVTTVELTLPGSSYGEQFQQVAFFRDLIERIAGRPEVEAVGATNNLPLTGAWPWAYFIEGRSEASRDEHLSAEYHAVSPGYFRTMGIRLLSGRTIAWSDDAESTPVIVVNETMAEKFWPNEDPLGKTINLETRGGLAAREIIGVVADVKHSGLGSTTPEGVYLPMAQDPWNFMTLVIKGPEEAEIGRLVLAELAGLDDGIPADAVLSMEERWWRWNADERFIMLPGGFFAVTALVLAALGIYGVISYMVSLRTNEFGVRMALGARSHQVLGSVVGQGVRLVLVGSTLGLALSLWVGHLLADMLFGVAPTDWLVFLGSLVLVIFVAVLACYLPARRATMVDPAHALRDS